MKNIFNTKLELTWNKQTFKTPHLAKPPRSRSNFKVPQGPKAPDLPREGKGIRAHCTQ